MFIVVLSFLKDSHCLKLWIKVEGCRAVCMSCLVRYEKQQFFDLSLLSPIPPPQAPGPSLPDPSDNSSSVNIVELVVPTKL
ncbi:hypothetical protein Sjap_011299 [Stephania japonica]|uniref:Uncharacterized protein n=1 Tax=Stephania japonica TaxID=461633 RepID=A0AAP0JAV6_9MAGN